MQLLTIRQTAKKLGISESYAYLLAERRQIPVVKLGRAIKVPEQQLDEWLLVHVQQPLEYRKHRRL